MLNERIGPETARFAVLGQSLPHTWSPYIHNSLFDAAGLRRGLSACPCSAGTPRFGDGRFPKLLFRV